MTPARVCNIDWFGAPKETCAAARGGGGVQSAPPASQRPALILIGLGLLCHEHAGVEQMPSAALARPFDCPLGLCMREVEGPRAAKPPLSGPRIKRSTRPRRRLGDSSPSKWPPRRWAAEAAGCVLASCLGDTGAAGRAGARVALCLAPLSPPLGARAADESRQTGLGIARGASRPAHRAQAAWAGGAACSTPPPRRPPALPSAWRACSPSSSAACHLPAGQAAVV